ncbi:MAG: TetM/TetW/TetO/TetS family tetracycline resistance ribosomal protection protein [Firmicutes bacterium]|nr:TetM/TetW/TetO/TetS family tetracycline resistance ribosomal protection protein [Bacillota bacterium]
MKHICIGVMAHVDAGKTTLLEAMLYRGGATRRLGRVDHQNAFLDTDEQERARGITIFSKQAELALPEASITFLDTPGHVDFSAEMERTLQVLDFALLLVSGTDGVQSHTRTLWQLLRRYRIPTFLFVNKMDLPGKGKDGIMEELRRELSEGCVAFDEETAALYEELALFDEGLMEQVLETGKLEDAQIAELIAGRRVFPCFFGAALRMEGVDELLSALQRYTKEPKYPDDFSAQVYKIARGEKDERLTFLKVTGGTLAVKQVLRGEDWEEKADQLRLYSGSKFTLLQAAPAGTICAVTGLNQTQAGEHLGSGKGAAAPVLEPVLEYRMHVDIDDVQGAYLKLRRLEEEDPQLHLLWDHQLREIRVQLMGAVQMEILQKLIQNRFDLSVSFDEGNIVYKETIVAPVEGVGHYEPLRHYAEVHLLLEPGEPGSGIVLDTMCSEDVLARNWQRLIFTHLQEAVQPGVLTGSPVTDLRITIISGKAHLKHTEGGDFRQATYRAVRQGLRKAQSVLLEPWYAFRLEVPANFVGRAMTDLERMRAVMSAPEVKETGAVILGAGPVRLLRGYTAEVTAYTRGQGRISYQPDGYKPCPEQDEIVQRIGYDPERDLLHPTGSVFCSHGAGFEVKWDEVDRMAHLPLLDFREKEEEAEAPKRIVRSIAPGGAPELEKELLTIFERTYGQIKRRDVLPMMALRSQDKRELLAQMEPAEEFVLVDGYNIIFAWDELKGIGHDSLDAARHVLMNLLCNYQGYRGCNLILVFDAYKVPQNLGTVEKYHNIFIVYTQEAETADSYIERVTYELRGRKKVRVATSDNLEQLIILGHGAVRVSAKSFHDEVMQTQQEIERVIAQNNQKSK